MPPEENNGQTNSVYPEPTHNSGAGVYPEPVARISGQAAPDAQPGPKPGALPGPALGNTPGQMVTPAAAAADPQKYDPHFGQNYARPSDAPTRPEVTASYPDPTQVPVPQTDWQHVSGPAPNGLTGSQLIEQNAPMPKRVYVIAALCLLSFLLGLFDSSQNSVFYIVIMLINLLVAVGLLVRLELARVAMIGLMGMTLLLCGYSFINLYRLQNYINSVRREVAAVSSKADKLNPTEVQQIQITALQNALDEKTKQLGRSIDYAYIKLSLTVLESGGIIYYLLRPKVKESFRKLEG
jgi:hypothetical protein